METIFSDVIFFIIFIFDCIHICFFRHCCMERSIKHSHMWNIWHFNHTSTNTCNVCWHMQRSKWNKFVKVFQNFFCNQNRFFINFPTMKNSMSNRFDFFQTFNNSIFFVRQDLQNFFNCFFMIFGARKFHFFPVMFV